MEKDDSVSEKKYTYPQKIWIACGILALLVIVILLVKAIFSPLLLVLAGTLVAVFFRSLGSLIKRKTHWNEKLCLAISIFGSLIIIALLFWLIGAEVQNQVTQLSKTFPSTIENAKKYLTSSSIGDQILEKITSSESQKKIQSFAKTFFSSTFGILGDLYVILFIGIFFTISPETYKEGIVKLVPTKGKKDAKDTINHLAENLKNWLKGKLFSMLIVFILTATGLFIIGMPMWLVLSLLAGLLSFIPNFGPLIAIIPAVMVALMQGPTTAVLVAGLYILVQFLESNFITPFVQKKLVSTPPALILIAQLIMASLSGGWGIVLATPIMVILMVLINDLYIKKQGAL